MISNFTLASFSMLLQWAHLSRVYKWTQLLHLSNCRCAFLTQNQKCIFTQVRSRSRSNTIKTSKCFNYESHRLSCIVLTSSEQLVYSQGLHRVQAPLTIARNSKKNNNNNNKDGCSCCDKWQVYLTAKVHSHWLMTTQSQVSKQRAYTA